MIGKSKKTLTAEVAALREEVRELRRALEELRPGSSPSPLPGEVPAVEMLVDQATQIADERDDLARQLAEARRELEELKQQKPRRTPRRPFSGS